MNLLKILKLALFMNVLAAVLQAQVLLSDTFIGSSLDTAKWSVILPTGSSSVVQTSGTVTTTGRGILATVAEFSGSYSISGTFTMQSDVEHFNVAFRTDLSSAGVGSSYERAGMLVSFSNDGNEISIQRFTSATDWTLLASATFALNSGEAYDFTISDNGNDIALFVDGSQQLSASSAYFTGAHVAFYSREFAGTSTVIDNVAISSIPEPSTYVCVIGTLSFLGVVICRRRRNLLTSAR